MENKHKMHPVDILMFMLVAIALVLALLTMAAFWFARDISKTPSHSEEIIEDVSKDAVTVPVISIDKIVVDAKEISLESTEPSTLTKPVEPEETVLYFDVPLDEQLQDHIFAVCEEYRIEPSIIIAMIQRESGFRDWVKGDGGESYGLMQIQKKWHKDRMKRLGVTDLLDPYQNILVGVDILAELFERYDDIEWVLMAYNGGASYANALYNKGVVSAYATGVIESARELRDGMA